MILKNSTISMKKIIFLLIVGSLIFSGCSVSSCKKAGEASYNVSMGPDGYFGECCEGLIEISGGLIYEPANPYADKNGCISLEGGATICSDCGNGICGKGENYCNCPNDCQKCINEGVNMRYYKDSKILESDLKCCPGIGQIKPWHPNLEQYDNSGLKIIGHCTSKCGNGICDKNESTYNCPQDCTDCLEEGEYQKFDNTLLCCNGLNETRPKDSVYLESGNSISKLCTAKCGNNICDQKTEDQTNCPEDCKK